MPSEVVPAPSGSGVSPVGWEELPWVSKIPTELMSRTARSYLAQPYRAALVPDIAAIGPALPSDVVALDADATAEIARFDAEMGAELAPFESVLLRSESASSSMIENLTSGAKSIALAEMAGTGKRNAMAIVANAAAMTAAIDLADRLDEGAILSMHHALLREQDPDIAGRWRTEQVWIGGDAYGPHTAAFVPPHHRHVQALLADLVVFAKRTDLPVLSQAAIAHAQFGTIHPFADGNGRTGRALIHAIFRGQRLTRHVTVPVSAGLLTDTAGYFDTLTAYRRGDPLPIIRMLATATFTAIGNARHLVRDLREIREGWNHQIAARHGAAAWRLADLLLRRPVIDAHTVAHELGISPANALRPIEPLVAAGVLIEFTGAARNRMWQASQVLAAIDAFAARAGRRVAG